MDKGRDSCKESVAISEEYLEDVIEQISLELDLNTKQVKENLSQIIIWKNKIVCNLKGVQGFIYNLN